MPNRSRTRSSPQTELNISQFFLVPWLAPLASEAPELLVAGLFAWQLKTTDALTTPVSSKVNQWSLLVGTLPVVFALSAGSFNGLPIDTLQREELLTTAAQSLFAVSLLVTLSITVRGALTLFGLFAAQFVLAAVLPPALREAERLILSGVYVVLAIALFVRQRHALVRLLHDGRRTPYSELTPEPGLVASPVCGWSPGSDPRGHRCRIMRPTDARTGRRFGSTGWLWPHRRSTASGGRWNGRVHRRGTPRAPRCRPGRRTSGTACPRGSRRHPGGAMQVRRGEGSGVDIAQLILDDHHEQRRLFAVLEQIDPSDTGALRAVWQQLETFLEVHAQAEEELFYPELLAIGRGAGGVSTPEAETEDAIADHNEIRDAVAAVAGHEVGNAGWFDAVAVANQVNGDHMAEEEREGLTDVRRHSALSRRHELAVAFAAFEARHRGGVPAVDKDPEDYIREVEAQIGQPDRRRAADPSTGDATGDPPAGAGPTGSLGIGSLKGR